MFTYLGEKAKTCKRLLASRALSGWDDVYRTPFLPVFVTDYTFTEDVIGAMVLHAYGEHLRDMGKSQFLANTTSYL